MWLLVVACRNEPDPKPTTAAHSATTEVGHSAVAPHSAEVHSAVEVDSGGPPCWDSVLASGYRSGVTDGLGDDVTTACGAPGVDDWVGRFVAPAAGRYVFDLADIDSYTPIVPTLQLLDGCDGASLGCATDTFSGQPTLTLDLAADEAVLVVVEAPHPYPTSYVAEAPVRVALAQATEASCVDGFDDDADGDADCADADCAAEPRCDCVVEELAAATPVVGSTVGAGSSVVTACSYYGGNDRSYHFVAPAAGTWRFEATSPSRAVVSVSDRCDGAEYACDSTRSAFTGGAVDLVLAAGEDVVVTVETMYGDDRFALEAYSP
jgi:hypothetical protein